MKLFNALELLKTIQDDALYAVVCEGFMSIYESTTAPAADEEIAEDYFLDHIDNLAYPDAQAELNKYSIGADTIDIYTERIGPIANKIALAQAKLSRDEYATMSQHLDTDMDEVEFDEFSREMKRIENTFNGHNSVTDYEEELNPELMAKFVNEIGNVDDFVQFANTFIYYDKLNNLLHNIKHELLARMAAKN